MKASKFLAIAICMAVLAVTASLPVSSYAATITLDFGGISDPTFGKGTDLEMRYPGVATDINATLTAGATFNGFNTAQNEKNGSVAGDIRVNMTFFESDGTTPQSVALTLKLWDATDGDGYASLYDPGVDYDYTLAFYDIDRDSDDSPVTNPSIDVVTLMDQGTYSVTATTQLDIDTSVAGQATFRPDATVLDDVPGQGGLSSPITQEQANVMVLYNIMNSSSVSFIYGIEAEAGTNSVRNLLIDGGDLANATCSDVTGGDCGFETPVNVVPIPGAVWLFASGFGALVVIRRKTKR